MSGETLLALAQFAGQTVAAAAITDAWESVRGRFASVIGHGNARKTEAVEVWLTQTREQLAAADLGTVEQTKRAVAERWTGRFADLLDEHPDIETELRMVVEEVAAQLPAGTVSAADYSVVAGRDVRITAAGGSVAAGVIHGDVARGNPTRPGSGIP